MRQACEGPYRPGGLGDGFRKQPARFIETMSKPGLVALLQQGHHLAPHDLRHQQLHGVGAHVSDCSADGLHSLYFTSPAGCIPSTKELNQKTCPFGGVICRQKP